MRLVRDLSILRVAFEHGGKRSLARNFGPKSIVARVCASRRGGIAVMTALLLPLLVVCMAGALDISSIVTAKTRLNDATDAAALAVSASTAKNPNITKAALQTIAQSVITTDFNGSGVTLSDFHVCAPVQADCTTGAGATMASETVLIAATATAPCYFGLFLPGVCTGGNISMPIHAQAITTIGFAANIQINMLLDTSASMIVGATPAAVSAISTWVSNNWSLVHYPGDSNQSQPCAFACHDEGPFGATTPADIQLGLSRAQTACGYACTRYDVMIGAGQSLITHIQTEVSNSPQLSQNSYMFNVYSINDRLNSPIHPNTTSYATAMSDIGAAAIGINTHINENFPAFVTAVGTNGNGNLATTPLKFVIIVTDGLESDFNQDFYGCTGITYDPLWNQNTYTGCFSKTIDTTKCTTMKNNGVVVAVLETPYVPLTGQDPTEQLYEAFVRHTIYPGGPSGSSVVSAALSSCASSGYYFQASSSSQIATGFITLTDKFLGSFAYLRS